MRELLHATGADEVEELLPRKRASSEHVAEPLVPRRRLSERIRYWLPAVVVFALGIVAWQWILPDLLDVESFLVPRFSDVLAALGDNRAQTRWTGRGSRSRRRSADS